MVLMLITVQRLLLTNTGPSTTLVTHRSALCVSAKVQNISKALLTHLNCSTHHFGAEF